MRYSVLFAPAFVVSLATACASSGSTGMTSGRLSGQAREVSANLITTEEISRQSFKNAWQAILSLRPAWPHIDAYVGSRRSSFENLQDVPIGTVKEIRLLSREQARVRFGPEAQEAILVVTK